MPRTRRPVAFVGCGYTMPSREKTRSETDLAIEAGRMAIHDAGLDPASVDGINIQVHHYPGPDTAAIARGIGITNIRWHREGGSPARFNVGILPAGLAAEAIDAGACGAVLICKIMNTTAPVTAPKIDGSTGGVGGIEQFEVPYGLGYGMQRVGLTARRYMHRYGVTAEQIGWICVVQREGALLNPWAVMRKPLTISEYLDTRWIADPVRLLDCDMPVNAAFAFVLARGDIAKSLRHPPVYLAAWAASRSDLADHLQPEFLGDIAPFAVELYRDASMTPEEMDLWFMYDGFSFFVPRWMESLGLVPRGEGGNYVSGGQRIRISGDHPLNPHGGQLSEGRLHGIGHILEAVQQLRGTAGPRQAKRASTAIVSSATPSNGAVGILARYPAL
jgi:acetyl-CoA acetyltransferase